MLPQYGGSTAHRACTAFKISLRLTILQRTGNSLTVLPASECTLCLQLRIQGSSILTPLRSSCKELRSSVRRPADLAWHNSSPMCLPTRLTVDSEWCGPCPLPASHHKHFTATQAHTQQGLQQLIEQISGNNRCSVIECKSSTIMEPQVRFQ
jgi:hypothetical protein